MRKGLETMVALGCVVVAAGATAQAQTTGTCDTQQQLINEVVELRVEVTQYLLDAHRSNVRSLTGELDRIHQEQRRVQEEERGRGQRIVQIEQQLASPEMEPETRPQLEAARLQLINDDAEKLRSRQTALQRSESDTSGRLQREMQLTEVLQRRADQVQQKRSR